MGSGINVGASQSAFRCTQDTGPPGQGEPCSAIARAVDDENFPADIGIPKTLLAPGDELGNCELLVYGRYDNRYDRVRDVVVGNQKLDGKLTFTIYGVPLAQ